LLYPREHFSVNLFRVANTHAIGDHVVPRSRGFETFGQRDALEFDANVESPQQDSIATDLSQGILAALSAGDLFYKIQMQGFLSGTSYLSSSSSNSRDRNTNRATSRQSNDLSGMMNCFVQQKTLRSA